MSPKIGAIFPEVFRHLFQKPATVHYPFVKGFVPKGLRGKPVMDPHLCIGCKMCERDCPSEAIEIHQAEPKAEAKPAEAAPKVEAAAADGSAKPAKEKVKKEFFMVFYLDRCTHCAQCEEVCPRKAIVMDEHFEDAALSREALKFVYKL
jgi:hydrogenase-4 component H